MFWRIIKREIGLLTSRPMWIVGIIAVPVFMALFFLSLLGEGLPKDVPAAIVDLDHSEMSRNITRSLDAMELVDIEYRAESFNDAMAAVQRGDVFGFFVIPADFERDAVAGRGPVLTFYSNLTFYVPGTMIFKGFKTMGVTTSGAVAQTTLVSKGAPDNLASTLIQPMTVETHALNNPWLNYNYYLSSSFLPGILELMIFIMTAFAITHEIKTGGSKEWIAMAHGNMPLAIVGKLLPQTIAFTVIGLLMNAMMYGWHQFPLHCPMLHMTLGMILFVIACQSFAVITCCIMPNLRLSLSICCLLGILAFSVAAFSFPVQNMYGAIGIFSYIYPVRHYFEIYIDQALNGIDLYYTRWQYVSLLVFPIVATLLLPLLRKRLEKPVYVP